MYRYTTALLANWKSGACQPYCELPGAVDLDGFVDKLVSANVSLVLFKESATLADQTEVVWKYGDATCVAES